MTAERAVRVAILKQYRNLIYEELAFHMADSSAFRAVAKLGRGQYPSSTLIIHRIPRFFNTPLWSSPSFSPQAGNSPPAPGYEYSNHKRGVEKQVAKIRDTKKEAMRVKCYRPFSVPQRR
jgi:hypothetical protein